MQGMSNNYMRQGNMNTALQYLGKAIELYPNYGEAYRNMAYAYSQLGNSSMAEQAMQRARQLGVQ
jgi:Tfp pilus assembly protein PilF